MSGETETNMEEAEVSGGQNETITSQGVDFSSHVVYDEDCNEQELQNITTVDPSLCVNGTMDETEETTEQTTNDKDDIETESEDVAFPFFLVFDEDCNEYVSNDEISLTYLNITTVDPALCLNETNGLYGNDTITIDMDTTIPAQRRYACTDFATTETELQLVIRYNYTMQVARTTKAMDAMENAAEIISKMERLILRDVANALDLHGCITTGSRQRGRFLRRSLRDDGRSVGARSVVAVDSDPIDTAQEGEDCAEGDYDSGTCLSVSGALTATLVPDTTEATQSEIRSMVRKRIRSGMEFGRYLMKSNTTFVQEMRWVTNLNDEGSASPAESKVTNGLAAAPENQSTKIHPAVYLGIGLSFFGFGLLLIYQLVIKKQVRERQNQKSQKPKNATAVRGKEAVTKAIDREKVSSNIEETDSCDGEDSNNEEVSSAAGATAPDNTPM